VRSPVQLDIVVVGAGLSGLATSVAAALSGHNVTVFESARELREVIALSVVGQACRHTDTHC
jgi:salicylate hydroxylase